MPRLFVQAFAAMLVLLLNFGAATAQNSLLQRLVQEGTKLDGDVVKVPPPIIADGVSAADQQQALQQALAKVPGRIQLPAFLQNNLNAPYAFSLKSLELPSGKRTGRSVDLAFVAHGSLKTITDRDMLGQLLGADEAKKLDPPSEGRELTADELAKRKITLPAASDSLTEGYSIVDFPLLEKVRITGVGYGVTLKTAESVTAAAVLDDRFMKDPEFSNRWRSIYSSESGRVKLGDPNPYSGFAGYTKVTQLKEPAGALLIESHVVFEEPQGWFGGANYLGSKLPIAAKKNVESFRRKLKAAEK